MAKTRRVRGRRSSRRTQRTQRKQRKYTKKQRGGNKFNPTDKQKQNMLKEAQNSALPHQKAVIFQTNSGYWTTRYVDKSNTMLKAETNAAESAAAHASRKAKNTTADSNKIKALMKAYKTANAAKKIQIKKELAVLGVNV